MSDLHPLLAALEQLTGELVFLAGPANKVSANFADLQKMIRRRGVLIEQLSQTAAEAAPLSYSDYNRMVILQVQGQQICHRIQEIRSQLAIQTTAKAPQNAYRHCLEAMIPPVEARHVDTV